MAKYEHYGNFGKGALALSEFPCTCLIEGREGGDLEKHQNCFNPRLRAPPDIQSRA